MYTRSFSKQISGSLFTVYLFGKRNTPLEYTIFKHMLDMQEYLLVERSGTFALFMRNGVTQIMSTGVKVPGPTAPHGVSAITPL